MQVYWIEMNPDDDGVIARKPVALTLNNGCTLLDALKLIPTRVESTELLSQRSVSIYGKYGLADTVLNDGDRIEILDSLRFNPMESRRRRVEHKKAASPEKPSKKAAPRRSKKQI